jgi:hypothetical protein
MCITRANSQREWRHQHCVVTKSLVAKIMASYSLEHYPRLMHYPQYIVYGDQPLAFHSHPEEKKVSVFCRELRSLDFEKQA